MSVRIDGVDNNIDIYDASGVRRQIRQANVFLDGVWKPIYLRAIGQIVRFGASSGLWTGFSAMGKLLAPGTALHDLEYTLNGFQDTNQIGFSISKPGGISKAELESIGIIKVVLRDAMTGRTITVYVSSMTTNPNGGFAITNATLPAGTIAAFLGTQAEFPDNGYHLGDCELSDKLILEGTNNFKAVQNIVQVQPWQRLFIAVRTPPIPELNNNALQLQVIFETQFSTITYVVALYDSAFTSSDVTLPGNAYTGIKKSDFTELGFNKLSFLDIANNVPLIMLNSITADGTDVQSAVSPNPWVIQRSVSVGGPSHPAFIEFDAMWDAPDWPGSTGPFTKMVRTTFE